MFEKPRESAWNFNKYFKDRKPRESAGLGKKEKKPLAKDLSS